MGVFLNLRIGALALTLLAVSLMARTAGSAEAVDLELVLAVDVSRSIDEREYDLQRRGYVNALTHPNVLAAIHATPSGRIAVTLVEWSGADFQKVVVPWMAISDAASAQEFADRLLVEPRSFWGWTSISGAIDFSAGLFGKVYEGRRRVIDVSGDGVNNSGRPASDARDDALARGIGINGLVIMNDPQPSFRGVPQPPLDEFYRENVIGGPGAFVIAVDDFESFAYAMVNKLVKEVASLPTDPSLRLALTKSE
ncbi:MAG: DUF1194 domain-containing protein [Alphaproteobacteria bacterium]|nr:DUF1194 domain-containing protein [Alphaproteobacteria bacterium]